MIDKTKLILSNSVLRVGVVISVVGLLLSSGLLIYGHVMVTKSIGIKNEILDLSDPLIGKRYRRLVDEYNTTKEERVLLAEVRPSKQEIAYFVQALDELAVRSQVEQTVEVVTKKDVSNELKYSTPNIRYKLNIAGTHGSVINYMKEVNDLPYLMRVVSVQTTAPQEKVLADETLGTIIVDIASRE